MIGKSDIVFFLKVVFLLSIPSGLALLAYVCFGPVKCWQDVVLLFVLIVMGVVAFVGGVFLRIYFDRRQKMKKEVR